MNYNDLILLILIGLFAGFVGGSLGLGGGIIIVPALVLIMGFTQHYAQGTSLVVLLFPVGLFAVYNYHKAGMINWKVAWIMMIAVVIGSYFGSLVSVQMPEKILKKIFGFFILLVSIKMILGK